MSPRAKRVMASAVVAAASTLLIASKSDAALYIDLRPSAGMVATYDGSTYTVALPGTATGLQTFEIWARVTGANGSTADESLSNAKFAVNSAVASAGAAFLGNLSGLTLEGAWANPGQVGTASDINTDGIGDWGGNKSTGTAYIGINSAAGGYQPGSDFKIATVSFNIVGKNPDATAASGTKFAASPFMGISYLAYTALWTQDGPSTATANRKYAYTGTQNASYPQGQYLSGSALQFLIEGGTPVEVDYATLPPSNSNAPGGLGTMAKLLAGRGPAGATFDNWRAASPAEASGAAVFVGFNSPSPKIISDVVDLNGIPDGILFVLSMTYSDVGLVDEQGSAAQGHIQLGTLSPGGQWVPAQSPSIGPVLGPVPSFTAGLPALGTWGVDTVQNVVWQVVDHNSQFAVVPEPATVGLLSLAALGLTIRRRRAIA